MVPGGRAKSGKTWLHSGRKVAGQGEGEAPTVHQTSDRELFVSLLTEYNEYPERQAEIVARIEQRFERTIGIMVVDSCGFTRTVHACGIIPFLANLERVARLIIPCITRHGGRLLKREADNLFAVFPDPTSALRAALESCQHVEIANEPLPAADEMHVAIGLGYGKLLVLDDQDLFGDEMNLACKLGEDLADHGEILLTSAAHAALLNPPCHFEPRTYSISGVHFEAFQAVSEPG
jgi:adenylate cyclase